MLDELTPICVVCHRKLGANPPTLGERTFCEEHLHKVAEDRPSLWRATNTQLVLLPILLAIVLVVTQVLGVRPGDNLRLSVSLGLAVLPGLSWLALIFIQERLIGGETQFLPTVVLLGALVASAVGLPFLEQVADIRTWLPTSSLTIRFLGNVLLVGPLHMFLIYAVVRYTVLRTPVFERRVDGVLFAVATAVGYATMLNIQLVVREGGFDPASGIFRVIGDVVGHAGAAAVLGFFLGRYRLDSMPLWYLPSGLLIAGLIDAMMVYSRVEINRTSVSLTRDAYSPWPGLIFCFLIAGLSFAATYGLLRRANSLTRNRLQAEHD